MTFTTALRGYTPAIKVSGYGMLVIGLLTMVAMGCATTIDQTISYDDYIDDAEVLRLAIKFGVQADSRAFAQFGLAIPLRTELYLSTLRSQVCLDDTLLRFYRRKPSKVPASFTDCLASSVRNQAPAWAIHVCVAMFKTAGCAIDGLAVMATQLVGCGLPTCEPGTSVVFSAEHACAKQSPSELVATGCHYENMASSQSSGEGCDSHASRITQGSVARLSSRFSQGSMAPTSCGQQRKSASVRQSHCDVVGSSCSRLRRGPTLQLCALIMLALFCSGAWAAPPSVTPVASGSVSAIACGASALGVTTAAVASLGGGMDILSAAAHQIADAEDETDIDDRPLPWQSYIGSPQLKPSTVSRRWTRMKELPEGVSIATVNATKCLCIPIEFQKQFSELSLHGGAFATRKQKLRACAEVLASGSHGPLSASSDSLDSLVTASFSGTWKRMLGKHADEVTHDFVKVLDHYGTTIDLLPDKEKAQALAPFWKLKLTAKAFTRMLGATVSSSCWKLAQDIGKKDYATGKQLQRDYKAVEQAHADIEKRIRAKREVRKRARQGLETHANRGGRKALDQYIVDLIVRHCEENSKPSPDNETVLYKPKKLVRTYVERMVNGKKVTKARYREAVDKSAKTISVNTRHLVTTRKELFISFRENYGSLVSRSTFYKYIPSYIKRARQRTDVCPVCSAGGRQVVALEKAQLELSTLNDGPGKVALEKKIAELEGNVADYRHHRDIVCRKKEDLKTAVENLTAGDFLVIADYKENIKLRCGAEEDPSDFYEQQRRTLFGYVVTTVNAAGRKVTLYVDVLSTCLTHDSLVTSSILEFIEQQGVFKKMLPSGQTMKKVIVFSDNCKAQFRNKTTMAHWVSFQRGNTKIPVQVHFFSEYHGKSRCDSHFALLTTAYKRASQKQGAFVASIDDYIQTMSKEVELMGGVALQDSSELRLAVLRPECTSEELARKRARGVVNYSTVNVLMLKYDHLEFMKTRTKKMIKENCLDASSFPPSTTVLSAGLTEQQQRDKEWTVHRYTAPVVKIDFNKASFEGTPRSQKFISDYYFFTFESVRDQAKMRVIGQVSYADVQKDAVLCDYKLSVETLEAKICNGNARQMKEKEMRRSLDRTALHRQKFRESLDASAQSLANSHSAAAQEAEALAQREAFLAKTSRMRVNFQPTNNRELERIATRSATSASGDAPADLFSHRVHDSTAVGAAVVSKSTNKRKQSACGICRQVLVHRCPESTPNPPKKAKKGQHCHACGEMVYDHAPCRTRRKENKAKSGGANTAAVMTSHDSARTIQRVAANAFANNVVMTDAAWSWEAASQRLKVIMGRPVTAEMLLPTDDIPRARQALQFLRSSPPDPMVLLRIGYLERALAPPS